MFSYDGSKSKIVGCYPTPKFDKIIEPFAGSARYSLKYFDRDVLLVDKYEVIVRIWKWLQEASEQDVMSLPNLDKGQNVDDFNLTEEEKWLIGFSINGGSAQPKKTAKDFNTWNDNKKWIAKSLYKIKHWNIILGGYTDIKNQEATWFIDPPYEFGGEWYVKNNKDIDYKKLSEWCIDRKGQAIVCENSKASWLPFRQMAKMKGSLYTTTEVIWSNQQTNYDWETIPMFEGQST
jgi:16S rRNA G966 N2-methylase RsmD